MSNSYIFDPENLLEMNRLLEQDKFVTKAMGFLFPKNISQVVNVLDLACGPGGWVLDMGYHYPDKQVLGVDISARMIEYAAVQAEEKRLSNARFQQMSVLPDIPGVPYIGELPDGGFDLINARFLAGFMPTVAWSPLFSQIYRLLRSGGFLQITEGDATQVTSDTYRMMTNLVAEAMYRAGLSFSKAYMGGVVPFLPGKLRESGFQFDGHSDHIPHVVDYSAGNPEHMPLVEGAMKGLKGIPRFLRRFDLIPEGGITIELIEEELFSKDFHGIWYFSTLIASKS